MGKEGKELSSPRAVSTPGSPTNAPWTSSSPGARSEGWSWANRAGRRRAILRRAGKKNLSIATRKQHLAAIRHFVDGLVTRHAIILNPALSVRGERYQVIEGKTPEISVPQARLLLTLIDTSNVVSLRDRAILAVLAYTSSRAGAVASLRRSDFYGAGEQWMPHFEEKRGKSREIPVRHNLQEIITAYLAAAGLEKAGKDTPLFRAAIGRTGRLGPGAIHVNDICRIMKRRLADICAIAGDSSLPPLLSPHSFRVAVITDLLEQGIPLEDVQRLAGHADPRTTRLYGRRQQKGEQQEVGGQAARP